MVNGLYCQDSKIKEVTQDFFNFVKFDHDTLYGSDLVLDEVRKTPDEKLRRLLVELLDEYEIEILPLSEEVRRLAQRYVSEKIIAAKYIADALHIAVAAMHNIPVLVSWNFEHIVKHKTRVEVNRINATLRLPQIDICSPQEV